jgi:hypothetical protein
MRGKGEEGIGLPGRERAGPKGKGKESRPGCWAGPLLSSLSFSSFLFLFYTQTIQTILFDFK